MVCLGSWVLICTCWIAKDMIILLVADRARRYRGTTRISRLGLNGERLVRPAASAAGWLGDPASAGSRPPSQVAPESSPARRQDRGSASTDQGPPERRPMSPAETADH